MKRLLLLDTSALIHRAYHAIPPLTDANGRVVNAVYGVASTILSVCKQFAPDMIVAAFDRKEPTFRHHAYPAYKAHRAAAPDDLVPQFALSEELVAAFGITGVAVPGFEADDVIGTIALRAVADDPSCEVIIVTGDYDTLQLVSPRIRVFALRRSLTDTILYDAVAVEEKYGLRPEQLPDYKGLAGDASDNIPGVGGVGPKTATRLLQQHENLEGVFAAISTISGATRARLDRDKSQAFLSRTLGTIRTDVPIACDYSAWHVTTPWPQTLATFFRSMRFFSLIKRTTMMQTEATSNKCIEKQEDTYTQCAIEDVPDVLRAFGRETYIGIAWCEDLRDGISGYALSAKTGFAQWIPCTAETEGVIKAFLCDPARKATIVPFDAKALWHHCAARAWKLAGSYGDVLLAAYVVEPGRAITYETCVAEVLDRDSSVKQVTQLSLIPDHAAVVRAAQDMADTCRQLWTHYNTILATMAQTQQSNATSVDVLQKLDLPLVPILGGMERCGVRCDAARLQLLRQQLAERLTALTQDIYTEAGTSFNINSTQQLRVVLFEKLALPTATILKTKTGYSTAASELEKLRGAHPIVAHIEMYRELFKLQTTYVDALPQLIAADGRIHSTFHQAVTATGRLSSSDPNLQNIPIGSAEADAIRAAFIPADGYVFVSADYSQIDLRCVAHVAQDEKMIAAFREGADIHTRTAMEVFGVSASHVTKAMRRDAKALNFGLIYGMGAYGFARSAGIDQKEAQAFIATYFTRFAGVARYMEETIVFAKTHGYVETPFGRRRMVPDIHSPNQQVARSGERMAINMPIQGMAADIMKKAMIAVANDVIAPRGDATVRMVLQIHDEIICEVRAEQAEIIAAEIKSVMENVVHLSVPLVVDTAIGASWAEI